METPEKYLLKKLLKVNNRDTSIVYWRRSYVFIVNFEQISHLF